MSGQNLIDHEGIIDSIEGEVAHIKINSESACSRVRTVPAPMHRELSYFLLADWINRNAWAVLSVISRNFRPASRAESRTPSR